MDAEYELRMLKVMVRMLLNDLPAKRDWLDPMVEQGLRYHTNSVTPESNHRALLHTWNKKS